MPKSAVIPEGEPVVDVAVVSDAAAVAVASIAVEPAGPTEYDLAAAAVVRFVVGVEDAEIVGEAGKAVEDYVVVTVSEQVLAETGQRPILGGTVQTAANWGMEKRHPRGSRQEQMARMVLGPPGKPEVMVPDC
jgi:hypothetical protein